MDTSETFIKMSTGAMKFFPKHEWADGDFAYLEAIHELPYKGVAICFTEVGFVDKGISSGVIGYLAQNKVLYMISPESVIPLLRQDQLQEMIGLPYNQEFLRLWQQFFSQKDYVLEEETGFEEPGWAKYTKSMEQLWLAFVMKENHNKIWDGKEWVKG